MIKVLFSAAAAVAVASTAPAAFIGELSTSVGMIGGGNWVGTGNGFKIEWDVSQNMNGTWHYEYVLTRESGSALTPGASHAVFQLSENITSSDIFNFGGNFSEVEFGSFGLEPGNPGFPAGESIFGMKIDFTSGNPTVISFDSTRQPMWGDFYAKGGSSSFAYNTDIGETVANLNDYTNPAVDGTGGLLFKILVPDTIPAPGAVATFALAGLVAARRRRN